MHDKEIALKCFLSKIIPSTVVSLVRLQKVNPKTAKIREVPQILIFTYNYFQ